MKGEVVEIFPRAVKAARLAKAKNERRAAFMRRR
jgi:hypothetical protein